MATAIAVQSDVVTQPANSGGATTVRNKKSSKTIDLTKARTKGFEAKGAALATLCVRAAWTEVEEAQKRGEKRRKFVSDIYALPPEGHAAFRAELQNELNSLTLSEDTLVKAGAVQEAESTKAGYSMASFRVMVSNWRTISIACEAGMKPFEADGTVSHWDDVLAMARLTRKSVQAASGTATGAQNSGRKALTPYDRALAVCSKLEVKDQKKVLKALALMLDATIDFNKSVTTH